DSASPRIGTGPGSRILPFATRPCIITSRLLSPRTAVYFPAAIIRFTKKAALNDASNKRNLAADIFRGLGLWILFIDHLEPNFWSHFTPGQFGFSDFAEI